MTFENIVDNLPCDCLKDSFEDNVAKYARALNKDILAEKDFMSKWDKQHRSDLCDEVCGLKGISVSKIENDEVKNEIVTYYSKIFKLSPKYRRGVVIFTIKPNGGVLKYTPIDDNKYHHDFYKADGFTLDLIEAAGVEYLSSVTNV